MAYNYISINTKSRRAKVGKSRDEVNLNSRQREAKKVDPEIDYEYTWKRERLEEATYIEDAFRKIMRDRGSTAKMPHHVPGEGNEGLNGDWFYAWDGYYLELMEDKLPRKYANQPDFFHLPGE